MAGQTFFGGSVGAGPQHIGRRWAGPDSVSWPELLENPCGCVMAPCGLVEWGKFNPDCKFHGWNRSIRQSHAAENCPAAR